MFHGSMVAIITPMTADGRIDYAALEQLLEIHLQAGTTAIIVVGTTGEAATLSQQEKHDGIRFVVRYINERLPVIAGTADQSTHHTIELTHMAMELGADAALIMSPAYVKPTQEGLFLHFQAIAKAIGLSPISETQSEDPEDPRMIVTWL